MLRSILLIITLMIKNFLFSWLPNLVLPMFYNLLLHQIMIFEMGMYMKKETVNFHIHMYKWRKETEKLLLKVSYWWGEKKGTRHLLCARNYEALFILYFMLYSIDTLKVFQTELVIKEIKVNHEQNKSEVTTNKIKIKSQ